MKTDDLGIRVLYNMPIPHPQETPGLHKCKPTPKSVECKKRRTKNRNKTTHRK